MREQHPDRDRTPARWAGLKVGAHAVIEREAAALYELKDGDRRERFRDRADSELRRGRVRDLALDVREPVALRQQKRFAASDEDGTREPVALGNRADVGVEPARESCWR